jgi:hypothetical protein
LSVTVVNAGPTLLDRLGCIVVINQAKQLALLLTGNLKLAQGAKLIVPFRGNGPDLVDVIGETLGHMAGGG